MNDQFVNSNNEVLAEINTNGTARLPNMDEVTVTSESVRTLSFAQATGDAVRVTNSNSEILISVSYEEYALMLRWALAQAKKWESQQEDDLSE